ncbi:MAG: hypothetical protein IJ620_03105 [Bacteroidales bacterium]|nr:hypothetical protein [Bacteroidales bacterium]
MRILINLCFGLLLSALLASCGGDDYVPKPTAYLRLTYPEHSYRTFDTLSLPFTFEVADSATVEVKRNTTGEKWLDLEYPCYRGVVFLSYKPIGKRKDLDQYVSDSYEMVRSHYSIASGVDEQQFVNEEGRVYASTFRLGGRSVASTYQFWATDSSRHFLHGSFYLDRTPNNDSLRPLITYIQQDLDHLLETLRWR